jgi:hypothetical protein
MCAHDGQRTRSTSAPIWIEELHFAQRTYIETETAIGALMIRRASEGNALEDVGGARTDVAVL